MKYATKLGAYGLAVAAAFAVALAVLMSVSSTPTAEAATIQLPTADDSATAAPGDTVQITVTAPFARLSITDTADGVGASFASGGGQSVACSDNGSCDTDDSDGDTAGRQNVPDAVRVALNIDADSGEGHILVSIEPVGGTADDENNRTKVITVSKGGLLGSLEIKADAASDRTIDADEGISNLTVTVQNAASTPGPLAGQAVSITTTHGTVGCADTADSATAGTSQTCSATTIAAGVVDVLLTGGGVEGQAVVTARIGTVTDTVTVTLFGDPKNLTATPDQDSIEISGFTYVVLTVTDGAGNPVSGQMITPATPKEEVVGPDDDAVKVVTTKDTGGDTAATPAVPDGRGYSKDKPAVGKAAAIPACGDDNAHIGAAGADYDELFGADDAAGTDNTGEGTNAKGQCVVHVTAPEDTTDATKSATRGEHTLNFAIGTIKASAVIEVAGKPHSISTDAPPMVEPGSVTPITVSVFDDEDVLVGITSVKVRKVDGGGLIEDEGDGGSEMTSNGQSKFTFIAPSAASSSEILITAGDVNHRVTLQIGEAMPEEPEEPDEPSMPEAATLSGSSGLVIFSGGSLDELEAAALAHCSGGAAIWLNDGAGSYVLFPAGAAIAAAQAPARAVYPDGIEGPAAVNITTCEQDAMEDEG